MTSDSTLSSRDTVFFVDIGPFWQPECARNPRRTLLSTAAGSYLLLQRRKLGQGTSLGRVLTGERRLRRVRGSHARYSRVFRSLRVGPESRALPRHRSFHAAV